MALCGRTFGSFRWQRRCLRYLSSHQVPSWSQCERSLPCAPSAAPSRLPSPGFSHQWALKHGLHTSTKVPSGKVEAFILSDIGEGIREVVIKEWFIKEGDTVAQFDSICEVQSDKASVTITSRYDGVVKKIYHEVDDMALVGKALVDIEVVGESAATRLSDDEEESQSPDDLDSSSSSSSSEEEEEESHYDCVKGRKALAAPAVRRIARENKIHLANVFGTGKDGRVTKADILSYLSRGTTSPKSPTSSTHLKQPLTPPSSPSPSAAKPSPRPAVILREDKVIPLRGIKKAMVKAMNEALKIPHFGYCDEIDMGALVTLRSQLKGSTLLPDGVSFSYMPVIIKATSMALAEHPYLNASLDETGSNVIYKATHNIGFAMDTADGLLVPNIKDVGNLSVLEVASELARLMELGQARKLGADDITGGTFSLSNIGSIGGTYAKPVILPPEVAIGALGKIQVLPRFDSSDRVIKAHVMQVSWSADHRVVEGAQMARFSNQWKAYLENPSWMLLSLR